MPSRIIRCFLVLALLFGWQLNARAYDALEACRAQSVNLDEIHACLDGYLDLMDENLGELTLFVNGQLSGSDRAAFSRAQQSFYSFRRENCLWYLEIAGQRDQAEQVAKNCLADMSQQRLAELQSLVGSYTNAEAPELKEIEPKPAPVAPQVSNEPAQKPVEVATVENTTTAVTDISNSPSTGSSLEDGALALTAYFGQWQVVCQTIDADSRCDMEVALQPMENATGNPNSALRITRRDEQRTLVELYFPDDKLDGAENVSWRIDTFEFGAVPGSSIEVDDIAARHLIKERKFIRDELLPLFRSGSEVGITLLENTDGSEGVGYAATLVGFSRALTFADEFVAGDVQ